MTGPESIGFAVIIGCTIIFFAWVAYLTVKR